MSYIANLVHRTLGVTPVAQPVIQAKFAPQGQPVGTWGRDLDVAQTAAPALSNSRTVPSAAQSLDLDSQREAIGPREVKDARAGRSHEPALPLEAELATSEGQLVLAPVRQTGDLGAKPSSLPARSVPLPTQAPVAFNASQHTYDAVEEFHLMQPARPAQGPRTQSFSQSRETESEERPVVRVHIGRVDVRMVAQSTKELRASTPSVPDAKPASLDEYLRARQRGNR